jgi:hypothetical protein
MQMEHRNRVRAPWNVHSLISLSPRFEIVNNEFLNNSERLLSGLGRMSAGSDALLRQSVDGW